MKKRVVMILLAATMSVALVACGKATTPEVEVEETVTEVAETEVIEETSEEVIEEPAEESSEEITSEEPVPEEVKEEKNYDVIASGIWKFPEGISGQTVNNIYLDDPNRADKVTTFTTNGITSSIAWTGPSNVGAYCCNTDMDFILLTDEPLEECNWCISFFASNISDEEIEEWRDAATRDDADAHYAEIVKGWNLYVEDGIYKYIVSDNRIAQISTWPIAATTSGEYPMVSPLIRLQIVDENSHILYDIRVYKADNDDTFSVDEINEVMEIIDSIQVITE